MQNENQLNHKKMGNNTVKLICTKGKRPPRYVTAKIAARENYLRDYGWMVEPVVIPFIEDQTSEPTKPIKKTTKPQ